MVELQVIECPREAGTKQGDVMVSHKGRDGKFTPIRHDRTDTKDEDKERKVA